MKMPAAVLSCLGFMSQDSINAKYGGTGFFVGIKSANHDGVYLHLVTTKSLAKNVVHGSSLGRNVTSGPKLRLKSGDSWWHHPTEPEAVDVAVTIFPPDLVGDYPFQFIGEDDFASDQHINDCGVGPGDEVSIAGLFTKFSSLTTHFPIVRTGNIAMMPAGKLSIMQFGEMEAYLAEFRSIGGLNGCPIFVGGTDRHQIHSPDPGRSMQYSEMRQLHLLGLVHGHWDMPVDFRATPRAEAVNVCISIIVPAKKILEVLYHPELIEMRREFDQGKFAPMRPHESSCSLNKISQTLPQRLPVAQSSQHLIES